jgi:hypothetical protein
MGDLGINVLAQKTSVVVVDRSCFIVPLRLYPGEVSNEETFFLRTAGNCPDASAVSGPEEPD